MNSCKSLGKVTLTIFCLFDCVKAWPSAAVRPSLFSLLSRPLHKRHTCENIKILIDQTLEFDCFERERVGQKIQPGPTRRQKSCGTCSGFPPSLPPRCFPAPLPSPEIFHPSAFSPACTAVSLCAKEYYGLLNFVV